MALGTEVGLSPGDCVRWGPSPSPQKGKEPPPKFSAHFYCRQTAGCTKMPLVVEVGLSPGDFVLDGDPAPFPKRGGASSPIFGPFLFLPNGWLHQDATWYGGLPQPRRLYVRWGPSPSPHKRAEPPNFRPTSIVAKRLYGSIWHFAWRRALVQATLY